MSALSTLPKEFKDRTAANVIVANAASGDDSSVRRAAGRILRRREFGRIVFLDLVDRSGQLQLLCEEGRTHPWPVEIKIGDIVGATGTPAVSRRGEPSLTVTTLELLAPARNPLPDRFHGLNDVELRYRKRYLDLMINADVRKVFMRRAQIITTIRAALDSDGFIEVETPVLQPRYGGAFARPFVTHHNALGQDFYLRIATELYLKRLIVGGLERVYEIGKDFRNEGISYKHNPEFTMLEWYEAYADYRATMDRIEAVLARVAERVSGSTTVDFKGGVLDFAPPWRRVTFTDALSAEGLWLTEPDDLRSELERRNVSTANDGDWGQLIDHAFSAFVEPKLLQPTIVYDYPLVLSPFARALDDDSSLVERFEYFAGGLELGNAFSEINDSIEQAQRFAQQKEVAQGEPGDPDYVEALSYGMPPTGGLGLGIDRLTMLVCDQASIRDVVLFPAMREKGTP